MKVLPEETEPICLICPEGQISNDRTNRTVATTSLTCEVWAFAGYCGQIPTDGGACSFVQFATADCNCVDLPSSGPADPADPATPTDALWLPPLILLRFQHKLPISIIPPNVRPTKVWPVELRQFVPFVQKVKFPTTKTNVTIAETSLTCEVWVVCRNLWADSFRRGSLCLCSIRNGGL